MFYDNRVMNCSSLKNAWRAGTKQELCPEDVPLPKVCRTLDSWIASDYQDPGRRMSLRASSILVDGAAKLYKQGLNDLIEDVYKMEYQMITRKRRRTETELVPDLNTEECEQSNDNESNESSLGHSATAVRSDSSDANKGGKSKKNNISVNRCKKKNHEISRTKTSRTSNKELPIGQIFVYKNQTSKIPSKIIVGNINSAVMKNIKF